MSHVTCHMSHVTCHMSHVTCHPCRRSALFHSRIRAHAHAPHTRAARTRKHMHTCAHTYIHTRHTHSHTHAHTRTHLRTHQADTYELVQQVREIYADFYALSPSSFSLALPPNEAFTTPLADRTRDGPPRHPPSPQTPQSLTRTCAVRVYFPAARELTCTSIISTSIIIDILECVCKYRSDCISVAAEKDTHAQIKVDLHCS